MWSAIHATNDVTATPSHQRKGENITSAEWQVTLCDLKWYRTRVPVAVRMLRNDNCYTRGYFTLIYCLRRFKNV